jgi:uncharacterized RDD family membrane protein YckC
LLGNNNMSNTSYYASINKRFVAILIDGIFLNIMFFIACGKAPNPVNSPAGFVMYSILTTLIGWIYFAGMESSDLQATFGKRVLGIIVTNTNGNKISFGRATGRYFAKSIFLVVWIVAAFIAVMAQSTGGDTSPYWGVSGLLFIVGLLLFFIGYLMAGFTPEKQALHDIIARCLVVNGKGQSDSIPWQLLIGLAVAAIIGGRVILAQIPASTSVDTTRSETRTRETSPPTDNSNTSTSTTETPPSETSPPTDNSNRSTSTTETPPSETSPPTDNSNRSTSTTETIPKSGRFTICGSEERLIEPGNLNIDGDWRLEFSGGGSPHIARLKMQGDSGIMRVIFPDSSGDETQVGKVDQTMQLYNSSQGLVLLGFNPVNPDTGEPVKSYHADNFLIRREFDGSITVTNCDDGGNRSPVKAEPFTNSQ